MLFFCRNLGAKTSAPTVQSMYLDGTKSSQIKPTSVLHLDRDAESLRLPIGDVPIRGAIKSGALIHGGGLD